MDRRLEEGTVLNWCDVSLMLLPERAVWWPERATVFIADPHFGKAATFRAGAVPIPDGTAADLRRLDAILERTRPRTLFILGDLLHARRGRCAATFETIRQWRATHDELEIRLIVGNHDRHAGPPPSDWRFDCVAAPEALPPFQLHHHPPFNNGAALSGHLHPKFRLQMGGDRITAPGFLLRRHSLVLPAFGSFIDHQVIQPQPRDQGFIIAEESVCRIAIP